MDEVETFNEKIDAKSVISLYCILMGNASYSFFSERNKKKTTTMLTVNFKFA
jgi:hypothetical protein